MNTRNVLAIAADGGEATGKTTLANALAKRMGFENLDTGLLYRALTCICLPRVIDIRTQKDRITRVVEEDIGRLTVPNGVVCLDGKPVGDELRTPDIGRAVSFVSEIPRVRELVAPIQRSCALNSKGIVMVGRDITSVVLPDALVCLYLHASDEIRGQRRLADFRAKGNMTITYDQVLADLRARDHRDSTRECCPLIRTPDSIAIDTGIMPVDAIVECVAGIWDVRQQNLVVAA